jgi:ferric-dicitrate binding protein FerR (iron transport regulator)
VTIPPYARLAAKLLKREHEQLASAPPAPAAVREDAVAAIERALVARARKRTLQQVAYVGGFAAAAAALIWLVPASRPQPGHARAAIAAAPTAQTQDIIVHPFGDGARVYGASASGALQQAGARVKSLPHGRALLAFGTGTRVMLEEDADLTLVENDAAQVLALDRGSLRADVAKLAPGRRFLVHTADTEVEVHGTSFRVSTHEDAAHCPGAVLTRVDVFEGVVTVRNAGVEHRIETGGQWSATCPDMQPAAAAPEQAMPSAQASAVRAERARADGAGPALAIELDAARAPNSDLIVQNDAFAAAVAAHRAGDLTRAVRGFDDLLARFPRGPLAESASVQRLKVMRKLDAARARELARDYLERYPDGFARELAAAMSGTAPALRSGASIADESP